MVIKASRNQRTFEHVANHVRYMLARGKLRPGDRLPPERKLSLELKVSRSALREALRTLEYAGILELRQGKTGGAFVSNRNFKVLSSNVSDLLRFGNLSWSELTEARIWIEEIIVRVACQRATRQDIRAMQDNLLAAKGFFERGKLAEQTDAFIDFHAILARATRNPFLMMMNQTMTDVLRYFIRKVSAARARYVIKSRERFMAAFIAGDADGAVREMEQNLKTARRLYLRIAKKSHKGAGLL